MSQLFGECDFGIARETRRRFDARILLLQFNLGHDAFLDAYRTPAIEIPVKTELGAEGRRMERSPDKLNVNIHDIAGLLSFLGFDVSSYAGFPPRTE